MFYRNPLMIGFVATTIAAIGMLGCSRPAEGWVQQVREGGRAPDFEFRDEEGRQRRFHEICGELTVVMFSKCQGTTHAPVSPILYDLLTDSKRYPELDIIGVAVHWGVEGCPAGGDCHSIEQSWRVLSICDGRGAVRRLYGVGESESLVLLGSGGRVLSEAPASNPGKVRNRLADEIQKLDAERIARDIEDG